MVRHHPANVSAQRVADAGDHLSEGSRFGQVRIQLGCALGSQPEVDGKKLNLTSKQLELLGPTRELVQRLKDKGGYPPYGSFLFQISYACIHPAQQCL
ncbi:hypothetical protein EVAR_59967_1 [Eumeta japonica]|uniref:Uncharacterized protein n=1 Tax=Eumeta variegata TaxID=151549 RepID=A0A4C1YUZ8_EUMVA|nr:hypothetical protein EVAR_59967_1 [Eumeta japonica]